MIHLDLSIECNHNKGEEHYDNVYALQRERILKHAVIFTVMLSLLLAFFQPFTAKAAGGIELSTAYPGITVKAGEAVSVSLDLENNSGSSFDASLSAVSMPLMEKP